MASSLTYSDIQVALREGYQDTSEDVLVKKHPLLATIDRNRKFIEPKIRVPIKYARGVGGAPSFTTAQTNKTAAKVDAFEVTRVNYHQPADIDGEAVEAAALGKGEEFLQLVTDLIDDHQEQVTNHIALTAYRTSGGAIGTVGSGTSSPITMANIEEVDALEVGMIIKANDGNDATSMRSGTGTITAIDYNTGVVTYTGTITSLAVADYIFVEGHAGAVASGLEAWCPESAPGATEFFGVDRSTNSRLGGTRLDCSTYTPEEVFARVNARASRLAKKPDAYFVHPTDLANMEVNLSSQKSIVDSREYDFGFEALSAYGTPVIADTDCQRGVMWGVNFDHFTFASMGDAPKVLDSDGNMMLRKSTSDDYEVRIGARYQFYSDAPLFLLRAKLPV
jgi:hypothetical protein